MPAKLIEASAFINPESDYLMHEGRLGQRWGVMRGPPYPLDSGQRTPIKTVTKAAIKREDNPAQRKALIKKAKKDISKEQKQKAVNAKKMETAQKKGDTDTLIKGMTNAQLKKATERLKLENEYRANLPKVTPKDNGDDFLVKASRVMKELKVAGDDFAQLYKTGMGLAQALGLVKPNTNVASASDFKWASVKPGETMDQYVDRVRKLADLAGNLDKLQKSPSLPNLIPTGVKKETAAYSYDSKTAAKDAQKKEKEVQKVVKQQEEQEKKKEDKKNEKG